MEVYIAKALFATYVVLVSLLRLMAEKEFFRLTAMKKIFGRSRGLMIHFLSNVIVPMLFAIYCLTRGVVSGVSF